MSKLRWWILRRFNALHLGLDWMSSICGSWVDGARCPCQRLWLNFDRTTTHNQYSIWYHVQPNISASWLLKYFFLPSNMAFTRRFVGGDIVVIWGPIFDTVRDFGKCERTPWYHNSSAARISYLLFDIVWCCLMFICSFMRHLDFDGWFFWPKSILLTRIAARKPF